MKVKNRLTYLLGAVTNGTTTFSILNAMGLFATLSIMMFSLVILIIMTFSILIEMGLFATQHSV